MLGSVAAARRVDAGRPSSASKAITYGGFRMLVLTRKEGQQIVIGGEVWITVICINGGKVKLGVEGPLDIPVHREEIFQRINDERTASGASSPARNISRHDTGLSV
jgi:carbon storage regulator